MLTLAEAILVFDAILLAGFAIDFVVWSRRCTSVVAIAPLIVAAAASIGLAWRYPEIRGLEFGGVVMLVSASAWFGYANFLAFVKRGITFSILHNHAQPRSARRRDRDFIALADRIDEMKAHGWIAHRSGQWALTPAGQRVVTVRRTLLKVLRIEAVG